MIYFTSILWFPSDRQHIHYFTRLKTAEHARLGFLDLSKREKQKQQQTQHAASKTYNTKHKSKARNVTKQNKTLNTKTQDTRIFAQGRDQVLSE
jgi:hypothetical protein